MKPTNTIGAIVLVAALLPQKLWSFSWSKDQTRLINMRNDLFAGRPYSINTLRYPVAGPFWPHEKYCLFISPMAQPINEIAFKLLLDVNFGTDSADASLVVPASLVPSAIPVWQGTLIDFAKPLSSSPIMFFGHWRMVTADHIPRAIGQGSNILFRMPPTNRNSLLCVQLTTPASDITPNISLSINSEIMGTSLSPSEDTYLILQSKLSKIGASGDVNLSLSYVGKNSESRNESEMAGIKAMWVAPNCNTR